MPDVRIPNPRDKAPHCSRVVAVLLTMHRSQIGLFDTTDLQFNRHHQEDESGKAIGFAATSTNNLVGAGQTLLGTDSPSRIASSHRRQYAQSHQEAAGPVRLADGAFAAMRSPIFSAMLAFAPSNSEFQSRFGIAKSLLLVRTRRFCLREIIRADSFLCCGGRIRHRKSPSPRP